MMKEKLKETVDNEKHELTLDDIRAEVKQFEEYYKISSEEFMKIWQKGKFEDTFWTNCWAMSWSFLKKAEQPGVIIESDADLEEENE